MVQLKAQAFSWNLDITQHFMSNVVPEGLAEHATG